MMQGIALPIALPVLLLLLPTCKAFLEDPTVHAAYMACTEACERQTSCRQATFKHQTSQCLYSVDGGWSGWGDWRTCSASCGGLGKRGRTRWCTDPPPEYGGLQCEGSDSLEEVCTLPYGSTSYCPPTWSSWSAWSACPAECGGQARQERQRTCLGEEYGAGGCSGNAQEDQRCYRDWGQDGCPDSHYEVRVLSEGGDENSKYDSWSLSPLADLANPLFYISGVPITSAPRLAGLNIVVLDRATGNTNQTKVFTAEDVLREGEQLVVTWLDSVPEDSLVLVSAYKDAGFCGTKCMGAFSQVGATKKELRTRDSYALIGFKLPGCSWNKLPSWVVDDHESAPKTADYNTQYVEVKAQVQAVCNLW